MGSSLEHLRRQIFVSFDVINWLDLQSFKFLRKADIGTIKDTRLGCFYVTAILSWGYGWGWAEADIEAEVEGRFRWGWFEVELKLSSGWYEFGLSGVGFNNCFGVSSYILITLVFRVLLYFCSIM